MKQIEIYLTVQQIENEKELAPVKERVCENFTQTEVTSTHPRRPHFTTHETQIQGTYV